MSITVKNLSKHYGNQKAVDGISFTVDKAEIVGFLGPNGAGKSTTMKMITGYLEADAGDIQVCGITVDENSIETNKKIGYLPEANPLYPDMYVREYLQFVANVHQIKNSKQVIEEVIKTVGLSLESNKKIGQLSKGYKQRVGLAAALRVRSCVTTVVLVVGAASMIIIGLRIMRVLQNVVAVLTLTMPSLKVIQILTS